MIAVGGGGGGTNGHQSGGAGGYVRCAILRVQSCQEIPVTVGPGGRGAKEQVNSNEVDDCLPGGASAFGNLLLAPGGGGCKYLHANAGGTGSGAPCLAYNGGNCRGVGSSAGAGGSGGSNGGKASDGKVGGAGQGTSYVNCLKMAKVDELTAGAGGAAGKAICGMWRKNECWGAGGGGGGVLVNGAGPSAYDGAF